MDEQTQAGGQRLLAQQFSVNQQHARHWDDQHEALGSAGHTARHMDSLDASPPYAVMIRRLIELDMVAAARTMLEQANAAGSPSLENLAKVLAPPRFSATPGDPSAEPISIPFGHSKNWVAVVGSSVVAKSPSLAALLGELTREQRADAVLHWVE